MRLIALLAWLDEQPLDLMSTVEDLSRLGVTDLVAVDGAYANYPLEDGELPYSPPYQADALVWKCDKHKIGLTLDRPTRAWQGDEVAKRQRLLDLAGIIAGKEEVWLCIWDADFRLHGEAPDIHNILRYSDRGVDINITDDPRPADELIPESWFRFKMFMRYEHGMHMGTAHYQYCYPDGHSWWVQPRREMDAAPLSSVHVRHLKHLRSRDRLDRQRIYYERRDGAGLETV